MATTKKSAGKPMKKTASKNANKKTPAKGAKNKLGVKNSLVNNINAKKKKGASKPKKKSTVSKKAYTDMKDVWGKK